MPEGQFLGSRTTYNYTMDDGTEIQLVLDSTIGGIAGAGLAPATNGDGSIPKPLRFEPRGVYWQGQLGSSIKRKFIPCNDAAALYATNVSTSLTIDGVSGITTGRRGEKLSFAKVVNLGGA